MIGPRAARIEKGRPVVSPARPWPLLAALTLALGCGHVEGPSPGGRPVRADQVVDFDALYNRNCRGCHGADGKLGPAPPLNDPTFLAIVPDEVIMGLITEGRPGTPMPAFSRENGGPLTDAQVKALAEGLKPRWGQPKPARADLPAYLADRKTPGDPDRGLKVFSQACASCHGENGEGDAKGAGSIRDPAFLDLISDQCLRRLVITGRPDLGMPGFASNVGRANSFRELSPTDVADVVAALARWRRPAPAKDDAPRTPAAGTAAAP